MTRPRTVLLALALACALTNPADAGCGVLTADPPTLSECASSVRFTLTHPDANLDPSLADGTSVEIVIPEDEIDRPPQDLLHLLQVVDHVNALADVAGDCHGVRPFGHTLQKLASFGAVEKVQVDIGKPSESHRLSFSNGDRKPIFSGVATRLATCSAHV